MRATRLVIYAISCSGNGWKLWIFLVQYKVLSGIYDTSVSAEIPIISEYATRGNSLKIANRRCHYSLQNYSFRMRIINVWNSLPFSVFTAPSVNSYWK